MQREMERGKICLLINTERGFDREVMRQREREREERERGRERERGDDVFARGLLRQILVGRCIG